MYIFSKKITDYLLSLLLLILLSPLLLFSIFLIILFDRHNPFFFHLRAGKNGKPFYLLKLRSMKNNKYLADSTSITKLGYFLRKYKIDELPQLFNVLKGDLSIVGPRPLLISYIDKYSSYHSSRLNVIPGITGLSQINVFNTSDWKKKLDFDVIYVEQKSFYLDIKIIFNSIKLIFLILTNKVKIKEDFKFYKS